MEILENNLKLLSRKNPNLADKIAGCSEIKSDFILDEALSGDANLKKNSCFLHDNLDPEQEAINLLNKIENKKSNSFNFIYGMGLGYVLKRLNKSIKGFIIVYEPDIEVLRIAFELVDFSEELKNEKVFIFDTTKDFEKFYEKHFFYNYNISTSISDCYKAFDFDNAQSFIQYLGYLHGIYDSNYKAYWDKNHRWINAITSNLKCIPQYDELKVLKNKFKNKPAIVISAGPSLNKNIELISKYQDNFVIFCVGTALKSALKYNIKPDFICFVEYLPVTQKMLENEDLADTNIILQPITLSSIFDTKAKNKFLFYADNDEGAKWVAKKFSIDRSEYINRGTVSVNALVSAKILGCNPIILTGQDLAYTNNSCYADGSIYGDFKVKDNVVTADNIKEIGQKTALGEETVKRRLATLTGQLYHVKGQNGETLLAPGDYASFIQYFEKIAESYSKETKLINATEGGAQINGYENMKLSDVIKQYAQTNINKSFEYKLSGLEKRRKIIEDELNKTILQYDNFIKPIFDKANSVTSKMVINYDDNDNYIKFSEEAKELLKLYKELKKAPKTDLMELFFSRNIFFIDKYIKLIDDNTHFNFLINNLHILFFKDYNEFIIPQIEKIRSTIA